VGSDDNPSRPVDPDNKPTTGGDPGDTPGQRVDPDDSPTSRGLVAGTRVFGRYRLESLAGRGGMGVVWKAYDEKLERAVALKFLPQVVVEDSEAVRDLMRETKRCLELTHANIVRVHDLVQDGPVAAIAMEYVDGQSLAKRKATAPGGCLTAAELQPLIGQLCAALDYAHGAAKVVHRDLKPANLLVTHEGVLKVTDFGIARSLGESQTRLTGRASEPSGTLPYMSPQQLAGKKATPADDIYALGATVYELLAGKPPFYTGDVTHQMLYQTPTGLAARRTELEVTGEPIPPAWEETILACLAKEPQDRPRSAGEVAERLGLTAGPTLGPPAGASRVSRAAVPPLSPPAPAACGAAGGSERQRVKSPSRMRWLAAIGAAAAVVLAVGAWWIFGSYVPEQQRRIEAVRVAEEKQQAAERLHREALGWVTGLPLTASDNEIATVGAKVDFYAKTATADRAEEVRAAFGRQRDAILAERERARLAAEQALRKALGWVGALPLTASDNELAAVAAKVQLYSKTATPERGREVRAAFQKQRGLILAERERIRLANARGRLIMTTTPPGVDLVRRRQVEAERDRLESNLRETRRQVDAARAIAAQARQEAQKQATQRITVPDETPGETDARHQAVRRQTDEAAAAAFAKEHPFLPEGWREPTLPPKVYAEAIWQSDERALAEAQTNAQARVAALSARIAVLERQLATLQEPKATTH
jgi:hypothetical protein